MKTKLRCDYQFKDNHKNNMNNNSIIELNVVIYKQDNLKKLIPYILVNYDSNGSKWYENWIEDTERVVDSDLYTLLKDITIFKNKKMYVINIFAHNCDLTYFYNDILQIFERINND